MQTVIFNSHLSNEERESILAYDVIDRVWKMDTTVMKHYNRCKKQGWEQKKEYTYDDGRVCGGVFEAPERAITLRKPDKKQMSDAQMNNLTDEDE